MAIYKIFPEKTATLYSYYPALNTGLDEILEVSTYESIDSTDEVSRAVIKFSQDDITDVIANKIAGAGYDVHLRTFLANATSIPLNYSINVYTLANDWNMGTGRLSNVPNTTDGVSWTYTDQSGSLKWINGAFPSGVTGSYRISGSTSGSVGGGTWYTNTNFQFSQDFAFNTSKDINVNVTNTVISWYNSTIANYGFILKNSSSLEFTTASKFELKYFSSTTHTIYPPVLEFRWDDSSYSAGSLTVVTSSLYTLTLGNNKGEFQQDSLQRFRVNVRDIYPSVAFRTSLSYTNVKALPSSSYWAIKDLDTEEMVVDYDNNFTKISCDSSGNYFDVYMNGLEPERYYKFLIKSILSDGEIVVSDSNYNFKVIR